MNNTRKNDEKIESEVAKFLDKYYYGKLKHKTSRITDGIKQCKGIDVEMTAANNRIVNIDEKCKIRGLLNQVIPWPSFEIITKNKYGNYFEGWFVNQNNVTDYYAFISVFANTDDENAVTENNITKIVYLMVKKDDVYNFVKLSPITLMQDAESLRNDIYGRDRKSYKDGMWLKYSVNKREQPVNLVMTRDKIKTLPHTLEFEITRNTIKTI